MSLVPHIWKGAVAIALAAAACVPPRPRPPAQARLYRDLERLVTLSNAAGWGIDRYEVDGLLPEALASACRVPERDRRALLAWIDGEIIEAGGPVEVAYRERGRDLDKVSHLLELTRIKMVLAEANLRARADCPFWLEPSPRFEPRQLLDDRWVLSFGGGGLGIAVIKEGQLDVRGGGAGRLTFGRAFGPRWMLSAGVEAGALAAFPKNDMGERQNLVLGAEAAFPVVLRYRLVNSYLEIEGGYTTQVREAADGVGDPVGGVEGGVAVGAQGARRRFILPGAAFELKVERTFAHDGDPGLWQIKTGIRVAIDLPL